MASSSELPSPQRGSQDARDSFPTMKSRIGERHSMIPRNLNSDHPAQHTLSNWRCSPAETSVVPPGIGPDDVHAHGIRCGPKSIYTLPDAGVDVQAVAVVHARLLPVHETLGTVQILEDIHRLSWCTASPLTGRAQRASSQTIAGKHYIALEVGLFRVPQYPKYLEGHARRPAIGMGSSDTMTRPPLS